MFKSILDKLFTITPEKIVKKLTPKVNEINAYEESLLGLSLEDLEGKGEYFKARLTAGESLNDIMCEVFAVIREISKRTLNMRHFDVQLIGGIVLHSGKISEMKTGEGKTLVATLALSLNALSGNGVHLVTVNDYLAKRDALWMSPIYLSLGLSVAVIGSSVSLEIVWDKKDEFSTTTREIDRKTAYSCDIVYGTNSEFGFDYLRDNMRYDYSQYVQRTLNYAIVDEVDSILIDEARTPLIISGPTGNTNDQYIYINEIIKDLKAEIHYTVEEKRRQAKLTEEGINVCESRMNISNLYDAENVNSIHFVNNSLKAHAVFKKDVDYVVSDNQVIIIDEFTGRMMQGRRYSDGLHQALEAKENVKINEENQTYASITYQNYFRMYEKLSGMTGTALTEASELRQIYGLEVIPIPTHRKMLRIDNPDLIYATIKEKYEAISEEILRIHSKDQPILIGTVSIEKSEYISKFLNKKGIKHNVLNAKNHEHESSIIKNAGQKGSITIATNMAGRGTDIKLGEGVEAIGGLYILGTERHESRRIDNQLRGRSGRQGDNGESRFFLSMDDDLLRIFGMDKLKSFMARYSSLEGEPLSHSVLNRAIEGAQKKVEAMHFEMRKHLLEYDDVSNNQRKVIYDLRKEILIGENLESIVTELATETISALVDDFSNSKTNDEELEEFKTVFNRIFNYDLDINKLNYRDIMKSVQDLSYEFALKLTDKKEELGTHFKDLIRYLLINSIDSRWKDHLLQMDHLRDSVGLRGYGQKDPLTEFKKEAFSLFADMMHRIKKESIRLIMHVKISQNGNEEENRMKKLEKSNAVKLKESAGAETGRVGQTGRASTNAKKVAPVRRVEPKIGRNDPCHCGSGKKYKNCHGA